MARTSRRGPWLPEEDSALIELVHTQGPNNWVRISQQLRHRSPKQCRERYHQNLKPSLNHEPISTQEGEKIEQMVEEMGKRWAEIARRLGNRSDNAVKNWWNGSINRRRRSPPAQHGIRHAGTRLHPISSCTPPFEMMHHGTTSPGVSSALHFQEQWSNGQGPLHDTGKLRAFPTGTMQSYPEQGVLDARHKLDEAMPRLPPLRLPSLSNCRVDSGYGSGTEKSSVSPSLSEFSHAWSTRPASSLISDNQSTCSISPGGLPSPAASAAHSFDTRDHRWSGYDRPHTSTYQGVKGQMPLSPLLMERSSMPAMLGRAEESTNGCRRPISYHGDDKYSHRPSPPRRTEVFRDSRMHVSSLVQ